ncbi:MAG: ABC transporter ATP-binding protein [Candidatus Hodarchaeales archaeon]|jgi:putative ABC transport system ATP-binding protein
MIELENVQRIYKMGNQEINALKDLTLDLKGGQIVVILGPSGSGKTTLLNVLGAIDPVTSGTIRVLDYTLTKLSKKKLAEYRRKNVGFIFQFFNLLPIYTALENVEYAVELANKKMSKKEVQTKAFEYIKAVGLESKANSFPSRLSGGEQQRVAAARAFAKNPKLLLCDEPTGELNSVEGTLVLSVIQKLVKKNPDLLVVLVTHNQKIAEIGNCVIRLRSGEIDSMKEQEPVNAETLSW